MNAQGESQMGSDAEQSPTVVQTRLRQQVEALCKSCLNVGESDFACFCGQLAFCDGKETCTGPSRQPNPEIKVRKLYCMTLFDKF